MNEAVKNVLNNSLWTIATYSDEPNAVPVAFKMVTDDGRLLVGDVFLDTTLKNIAANGRVAVSAYDGATMEGYQVKGRAEHTAEGAEFEAMVKTVKSAFGGVLDCKGLVIIYPERVIVTTPGADNKKEL